MTAADGKLRLAFVSPLPPLRSGIAEYSARLLPHLAAHYDITVVVHEQQVSDPWVRQHCQIRDDHWFLEHGGDFDRVLYHFGNSPYHLYMFDLLARWPGVVVLHDFYLGQAVERLNSSRPGLLNLSLYRGWGYSALLALRDRGVGHAVWHYPLNYEVLSGARGVVVHSPYSKVLADQAYGKGCRVNWQVVPHLREVAPETDSTAAKARLGLPEEAFVVCSFGHITATKMHDQLLSAWCHSPLARDDTCYLVLVGEKPDGDFADAIAASPCPDRIRVTGWTDGDTYSDYLAAADLAIQLRRQTRGESSGAVLDCMGHGVATIVNDHGTLAELPGNAVYHLADGFATGDLSTALELLHGDGELRLSLSSQARDLIRTRHQPARCAQGYRDALESAYGAAVTSQAGLAAQETSGDGAFSRAPLLLVDVSALAHHDLKTGIERVVKAQLLALLGEPPPGFRVEPVYLAETNGRWGYRLAQEFTLDLLGVGMPPSGDGLVSTTAADILYIPDLNPTATALAHDDGLFSAIKARGTRIHVLVHDILPVTAPDSFPPRAAHSHTLWLRAVTAFADQLICPSRAVADDVRQWLAANPGHRPHPPTIAVNHHGADISASAPSTDLPAEAGAVIAALKAKPTFLMVGTIEPRKGHIQALRAFEQLWQQGRDINLAIVGREGWTDLAEDERRNIPETVHRLRTSPHLDRHLFWLEGISDAFLEEVYASAACLLAASSGEGFGLPLIEAAHHKLPILARDIPVFREVAGDHASYFKGQDPEHLAAAVSHWLELPGEEIRRQAAAIHWHSWAENVAALGQLLLDHQALPTQIRGCETLADLYRLDGERFVELAYWTFLGRDPSVEEHRLTLEALRQGTSKTTLAVALRYSREARALPQHLHLRKAWLAWVPGTLPVVGPLFRFAAALAGIGRQKQALLVMQQHLGQLQRHGLRLESELNAQRGQAANRLASLASELAAQQHAADEALRGLSLEARSLHQRQRDLEAALTPGDAGNSGGAATDHQLEDAFYVAFERHFRGSETLVRARLAYYLPLIDQQLRHDLRSTPMADIGCGRGEWLALLGDNHYTASGVDLNGDNVAACRERGLAAHQQDGVSWLRTMDSNSLALVSAFHVIEHLSLGQFTALLTEARRVLKPGGILLLETPNPENLITASRRFYTDPTHRNPVPAELTEFMVSYSGFCRISTHRLHPDSGAELPEISETERRLNSLLYGPQDYGVMALKPE